MDKENSKPYTVEDIKEFIAKAEADIQAGKIRTAENWKTGIHGYANNQNKNYN